MSTAIRLPARGGEVLFADSRETTSEVESLHPPPKVQTGKDGALGCVAPHAGYVTQAVSRRSLSPPRVAGALLILCPNHTAAASHSPS